MKNFTIPIPATPFTPPCYPCKRANKPFHLDGNINKPFWDDAIVTDTFLDIEGAHMPLPRFVTYAKMLWDDTNFYIAAMLEGSEIWGHITQRDDVIFYDNDFEIFIDPDSDTKQYYEFEMNVLNTVWDLFLPIAYRDRGNSLNGYDIHGLQTAVHVNGEINNPSADNKSWSVEVVIPFASISECCSQRPSPNPGDYYRVNFSRVQWKVDIDNNQYTKQKDSVTGNPLPEDNWVWAPTGVINIHYPEQWGFVFFCNDDITPDSIKIPDDEYRKWELRKIYYAQNYHKELNGCYTDNLNTIKDILQEYSPIKENKTLQDLPYKLYITPHSFEVTCPSTDGCKTIILSSYGEVKIE